MKGCELITWNFKTKICHLLDSQNQTCDAIIGRKSPSFDTCKDGFFHGNIASNNRTNINPKARQQFFKKRQNYKNFNKVQKFFKSSRKYVDTPLK